METTQLTDQAVEEVGTVVKALQDNTTAIVAFGYKVILAIVAFILGRYIIKGIRKVIRKMLEHSSVDTGVTQFVDSFLRIGLYGLLLFSIATKFGVDAASIAALIASAGVAVGLALQGSLSNFAGGVLILVLKPFVVGDYIIEDNNKNEGTVKEIQMFYTKLTTLDNRTIIIPNGMLTNNSLTNVTEKNERRLDLKIDISYNADLRKAKEVIRELLEAEDRIRKDDDMVIFVDSLGSSSVVLGVRAWTKTTDYWAVRWKLLEDIKLAMDREGIEIPYQQVTVHVKEEA